MNTTASAESPAPPRVLLTHHLRQLKLPTVLREYEKVAVEAAREGQDHIRYLLRLVELELIDRERRMVERRIRAARFPAVKSFDTFDFTAIPSLNKPLTLELARCEYVVARDNIIALGNSGTGKNSCRFGAGARRLPERLLRRLHDGGGACPSAHGGARRETPLEAPGAACRRKAADRRRTRLCPPVADGR